MVRGLWRLGGGLCRDVCGGMKRGGSLVYVCIHWGLVGVGGYSTAPF